MKAGFRALQRERSKKASRGCVIILEPGDAFGWWTITHTPPRRVKRPGGHAEIHHECQCKCGTTRYVRKGDLVSGGSTSCGCLSKGTFSARKRGRPPRYADSKKVMAEQAAVRAVLREGIGFPGDFHWARYINKLIKAMRKNGCDTRDSITAFVDGYVARDAIGQIRAGSAWMKLRRRGEVA